MGKTIFLEPASPSNFHNFNLDPCTPSAPNTYYKTQKQRKTNFLDMKITDFFIYDGSKIPMEVFYVSPSTSSNFSIPKRVVKKHITKVPNSKQSWSGNPSYRKSYMKTINHLKNLKTSNLREILQLNDQPCAGSKQNLIFKVADGSLNGKIPKCHSCGQGKPIFDSKTGKYSCNGFRDVCGIWNKCKRKFTFEEMPREDFKYIVYSDDGEFSEENFDGEDGMRQASLFECDPFVATERICQQSQS
jgi:hypothetical protein